MGPAKAIDEDAGILYDLVILGSESRNGNDYPESTMRKALPLIEGRKSLCNHNHANRREDPSVYDVLGVWKNCRVEEGKVRGNFHYFKSHVMAPRLVEAATRPELGRSFGFSINGDGQKTRKGDRYVIESITSLESIDCVVNPATTQGLKESEHHMRVTVNYLIESLKNRPGYVRALREMTEAGLMSPDATMDAPMDEPAAGGEPADHEEALKAGFKAAIHAIIDDDSLDMNDQMKKIKEILKARDKLLSTKDDAPMPDMPPAMESLKRIIKGQTLLSEARIPLSFANTKALEACRSDQELTQLVESLKGTPTVKARSSAPWTPLDAEENKRVLESKIPEKASDWARSLIE